MYRGLVFELTHNQCGVDSEHAEGVVEDNFDGVNLARLVDDEIRKGALRVEFVDVDRRVDDVVLEGGQVACEFEGSGGAHGVADKALGVVDVGRWAVAKDLCDRLALLDVSHRGGGGVRVDDVHLAGVHARVVQSGAHALGLALGIWQDVVTGVGIDAVAHDFGDDLGAACLGVFKTLQSVDGTAFGNDDAVAGLVKWAAGFVDVFVGAEGSLALEAGKNAEGLDTFADTTRECEVDFAEAQHLHRLDQAGVTCGTGGTDRIVRASDPHVDGDLASRVVRDGARIVVVGPELGVVVELGDVVDLVLSLDVAVFGGADVDADAALVQILKIDAAVVDGFVRAVNRDAAGAGADAEFLARLILLGIEVADTRGQLPHVTHVNELHTSDAIEEILAIFLESVAVWGGQTDACNNYTRLLHG